MDENYGRTRWMRNTITNTVAASGGQIKEQGSVKVGKAISTANKEHLEARVVASAIARAIRGTKVNIPFAH